jgi:hypothetical protein
MGSSFCALRRGAAALLLLVAASCGEERATGPNAAADAFKLGLTGLVQCSSDVTVRSQDLITSLGGVVSAGGSSISLPAGAVLIPTLITVTVPASKYVEIDVQANDLLSFLFAQPVSVTIDYSRCTRSNIDRAPLSVWHIDPVTKQLLERMDSVDDKDQRTITFTTGHLSAYAVAF